MKGIFIMKNQSTKNPHDQRAQIADIMDDLSPQAIVAIAYCIQHHSDLIPYQDELGRQLDWFAGKLVNLVGTQEYQRIRQEIGL